MFNGISSGFTRAVGDEDSRSAVRNFSLPHIVSVEEVIEDSLPSRIGQKFGPESDQSSRRQAELHSDPASTVIDHLHHSSFPHPHLFINDSDIGFRNIDK